MNRLSSPLELETSRQRVGALINASQVPHSRRLEFLPLHFGVHLMAPVQTAVFDWMERLSPACPGGLWHFMETSNGGAYLVPAWSDLFPIRNASTGYVQVVSADVAGIAATLLALTRLIWNGHHSLLLKHDQLMYFVQQHAQHGLILNAVGQEGVTS
jgi:hypothetical protein